MPLWYIDIDVRIISINLPVEFPCLSAYRPEELVFIS
jgi:hypothetical protein